MSVPPDITVLREALSRLLVLEVDTQMPTASRPKNAVVPVWQGTSVPEEALGRLSMYVGTPRISVQRDPRSGYWLTSDFTPVRSLLPRRQGMSSFPVLLGASAPSAC